MELDGAFHTLVGGQDFALVGIGGGLGAGSLLDKEKRSCYQIINTFISLYLY